MNDPPLFEPPQIGLEAETWDELEDADAPNRPKCQACDRPLRSAESQAAQIGPCCAAKIGRAVVARRARAAAAAAANTGTRSEETR